MARIAARAESEAELQAVGASDSVRSSGRGRPTSSDRITLAVSHAAWQAALDAGATAILCCTRSGRTARAIARFRPECRLVGLSPDPRTVNAAVAAVGRRARCRSRRTESSDEMVWFAVETALQHGLHRARRHRARAGRRARPPRVGGDRRAARRPGASDGTAIWSEEAGEPDARCSCSCTVRWTARPACSSCRGGSTTGSGCCATTAGATAARRPTTARSASTSRSPTSSTCSAVGPAVVVRAQLRRQRRARRWPTGTRSSCGPSASTRRRCRGSTGGRRRRPARRRRRAADDPAEAAERFMRRMIGDEKWARLPARTRRGAAGRGRDDGRGARRPAAGTRRGTRRASTCRPWRCAGRDGSEHHQRSTAHLGQVLADCPRRHDRGSPPLRSQHAPRRGRRGRSASWSAERRARP